MFRYLCLGLIGWLLTATPGDGAPQNPGVQDTPPPTAAITAGAGSPEQIARFTEMLKEVKFSGSFSVTGRENQPLTREEYFILSAAKLPEGNRWVITARIKYGTHDLTVPMAMDVLWAGNTPVITVDQLVIPGFGTFDARVLVHDGQYAGTWKHDEVGGHLNGRIDKLTPEELAELKKNIGRRKKSDSPDKQNPSSSDEHPDPASAEFVPATRE